MKKAAIEGITLTTITQRTGLLGRNLEAQEQLCLKTPGGHIYLSENTIRSSGDSWKLFKARLWENAKAHGIPLEDQRT